MKNLLNIQEYARPRVIVCANRGRETHSVHWVSGFGVL